MRILPKSHATPKLLRGHQGSMLFVACLSDDQIISASDEDNTLRRWSLPDEHNNNHNNVVKGMVVCAITVSLNGRWVAFSGKDGKIRILDLSSPKSEVIKSRDEQRHKDIVRSLSFSPDASRLASGAQDGTMMVWSRSQTTIERVAGPFEGYKDTVWCVCYSPDGTKIASSDREGIQIWEDSTWVGMPIKEKAWSLAWSHESDALFVGSIDGNVKRYSSDTGKLRASFKGHNDVVFSIAMSHCNRFFATASWDKLVRFWDTESFQPIGATLRHDAKVHSISISPDDSLLVSGARDSHVRVWDLRAAAPALFRTFPQEPIRRKPSIRIPFLNQGWGPGPSDTSGHDGSHSCHEIDSSSIGRKSPSSVVVSTTREQSDTIDGPRTPNSIVQSSSSDGSVSHHTGSRASYTLSHASGETHLLHPLDGHRNNNIQPHHSPVRSPVQSKRSPVESEYDSFIREIQSDPTNDLTGNIVPENSHPVAGGSQGDIYRGMLRVNGRSMLVAIKVIRRYTSQGDDRSKERRLRREIGLWLTLEHPNIIPLLGTTRAYGEFPAMVCPWFENGPLTGYLVRHMDDLTIQMRFGILIDVARGLQYLHSKSIVHGDISGNNVLIHGSGRACIADFGLSIAETGLEESSMALTYQAKGTLRYTAPELLDISPEEKESGESFKVFPTQQSDIYSFGGIMFQVLTGRYPYHHCQTDNQIVVAISKGERPRRPAFTSTCPVPITDDLWYFMMSCWAQKPEDRPTCQDMVTFVYDELLNAVRRLA